MSKLTRTEALDRIYALLYLVEEDGETLYDPDKEVSGGDLIEELNHIFSQLEWTPKKTPSKKTTAKNIDAVRAVNSCLNLRLLNDILPERKWNRFIRLLDEGELVFSGDPSGFHLKEGNHAVIDCASPKTSMMEDK